MDGLVRLVVPVILLSLFAACSAPRMDGSTVEGKQAILDAVDIALTNGDCAGAIATIEPLYNSKYTDNDVRLARAAAHACSGGISSMAVVIQKLALSSSSLNGPSFWELITKIFYHWETDVLDTRITAASNSVDALFAAVSEGTVVASANQLNPTSFNVGSLFAPDRIADSNLFLIFVSMAMIGQFNSRYGEPNPVTFKRGKILGSDASNADGWTVYDKVDANACNYAASVVNLLDAINESATSLEGKVGDMMDSIGGAFGSLINDACNAACKGEATGGVDYAAVGCGAFGGNPPIADMDFSGDELCKGTAGRPCLLALRNRDSCIVAEPTAANYRAQCAAAGIAKFVSENVAAGWLSN